MSCEYSAELKGILMIRGVEFRFVAPFQFNVDSWTERHDEGRGEPMSEITDIEIDEIIPIESITIAARETLVQLGERNNARTRKQARFLARQIQRELDCKPPGHFIYEDDLIEAACESL